MTQLVLSIGSNIDRDKHIRYAISQIREAFKELKISPVYETEAVGFNGPSFYNLVVVAQTDMDLKAIIARLQAIETGAGRIRGEKSCESRNLDIDVLLFGDADLRDQSRNIPRDEINHAAYVLKPLADVLPKMRHPVSGLSFQSMWAAFNHDEQILAQTEFVFDQ